MKFRFKSGNLLILLLSLFVSFCALEFCARLSKNHSRRPHSLLIYEGIPNARFQFSRKGEAPRAVQFNEWGFHDRTRALEKDPGVFRIAVVGDSFVESKETGQADSFTQRLENKLNQTRGPDSPKYEVLNFGVGGYGYIQYSSLIRLKVLLFNPDLVLITSYGNDFWDDTNYLSRIPFVRKMTRFFPFHKLFLRSSLVFKVYNWLLDFYMNREFKNNPLLLSTLHELLRGAVSSDAFRPSFQALESLRDELGLKKTKLAFMLIPATSALFPERFPEVKKTMETAFAYPLPDLTLESLSRQSEVSREWCLKNKIPVLSLIDRLKNESLESQRHLYLAQDEHWNLYGQEWASDMLYNWLTNSEKSLLKDE